MRQFIFFYLFSTLTVLGQNNGRVEYLGVKSFNEDLLHEGILLFSDSQSIYREIQKENVEEMETEVRDKGVEIRLSGNGFIPIYIVDRERDSLFSIERMFRENFILKESIPRIDWKILNEEKQLNTLSCQKAVGTFRGRTYTVWFAPEIPVPYGPWKLCGLPGLILEATDHKNQIIFKANKVKIVEEANLEIPELDGAVALRKYITEIIPKKFEELNALMISRTKDRNTTISKFEPVRESFKEVIYEWEDPQQQ